MKVVGRKVLDDFGRQHSDVRSQLNVWILEAEEAQWENTHDIRARYAHASFVGNDRVVFNMGGNKYRLDTKIDFKRQIILIKRIGTHAEYNRWNF